ncbi:MAG TPA: LbtU family siderophore porin [Desulfuromonadales bacterium]|nr:LbtU family siderophore porin [Desulfuromonadales bacterium]
MKKAVLTLLLLAIPALVSARDGIDERIEHLEERQAEIYHTLAGKKQAGLRSAITEKITISGLIEVEAGVAETHFTDAETVSESDIILATAQLGLGVELAEGITGDLILLYEEDATDLEVDEAAINFNNEVWFGRLGQQYVPFGVFHSHFISDPLILELGETRETALLAGYGNDIVSISAYMFNGDAEKETDREDHIRDWGLSLRSTPIEDLTVGASYISDLADSDAEIVGDTFEERVGGWSAFFTIEPGSFHVTGEVLGADSKFSAADLDADGDGQGDRPLTWNLELAWYPSDVLELSVRYEGSDEFGGHPETQYGICTSWGVRENVSLSLEYLRGEFDSFGDGADTRNMVTAQLGLEF